LKEERIIHLVARQSSAQCSEEHVASYREKNDHFAGYII